MKDPDTISKTFSYFALKKYFLNLTLKFSKNSFEALIKKDIQRVDLGVKTPPSMEIFFNSMVFYKKIPNFEEKKLKTLLKNF